MKQQRLDEEVSAMNVKTVKGILLRCLKEASPKRLCEENYGDTLYSFALSVLMGCLKSDGYDGLCNEDCGCFFDDFAPCGKVLLSCVAGWEVINDVGEKMILDGKGGEQCK